MTDSKRLVLPFLPNFILILLVFGCITATQVTPASIEPEAAMYFKMEAAGQYEMTQELHKAFANHLKSRMARLEQRLPHLQWSKSFDQYLINNRPLDCGFIKGLLRKTKGRAHDSLVLLTHNGKICTPRDLAKEQRPAFSRKWVDYLWDEKWIVKAGKAQSLGDLLAEKVGSSYRQPALKVSQVMSGDGYGWSISSQNLAMLSEHAELVKFQTAAVSFDPDSSAPFTGLGPTFQKWSKLLPSYSIAAIFQPTSSIYLGHSHGPLSMVEYLLHEYGHVFHMENSSSKYSWNQSSKTLRAHIDFLQGEAIAESFAWILLGELIDIYPELEFQHLDKLQLFLKERPSDMHLVGAAALQPKFREGKEQDRNLAELRDLAGSEGFFGYLKAVGLDGQVQNLRPLPLPPELLEIVPIYFFQKT